MKKLIILSALLSTAGVFAEHSLEVRMNYLGIHLEYTSKSDSDWMYEGNNLRIEASVVAEGDEALVNVRVYEKVQEEYKLIFSSTIRTEWEKAVELAVTETISTETISTAGTEKEISFVVIPHLHL